jgi:acyl-CoA reductase-like NAD-dependent aldehyde dehydrogenase
MELGGSDPFVVLADANVDLAVDLAIKSRIANAG